MFKEKLQKINKIRIFEQAVDQLKSLIENGEIPPGGKLPTEQELCDALSMSRSSIREALRVLETEGLIEIHRGTGMFVAARSSWIGSRTDVLDRIRKRGESLVQILQVRECIEGLTASLAALTCSSELISELSFLVDQLYEMTKNVEGKIDFDAVVDLNTRFHLAISKASGNDIAHEILLHILPAFSESNKEILFATMPLDQQFREHQRIINAIKSRDAQKAEIFMREHIARVRGQVQGFQNEP